MIDKMHCSLACSKIRIQKSQKLKLYTCVINMCRDVCVFSMFIGQSQNSYKNKDDTEKHKKLNDNGI